MLAEYFRVDFYSHYFTRTKNNNGDRGAFISVEKERWKESWFLSHGVSTSATYSWANSLIVLLQKSGSATQNPNSIASDEFGSNSLVGFPISYLIRIAFVHSRTGGMGFTRTYLIRSLPWNSAYWIPDDNAKSDLLFYLLYTICFSLDPIIEIEKSGANGGVGFKIESGSKSIGSDWSTTSDPTLNWIETCGKGNVNPVILDVRDHT